MNKETTEQSHADTEALKSDYWTVQELSANWKISIQTLKNMLGTGELAGFKLKSRWRISKDLAEAYRVQQVKITQATIDKRRIDLSNK